MRLNRRWWTGRAFQAWVISFSCLLLLIGIPVASDCSASDQPRKAGNAVFIKELPAKPQRGISPFGWTPDILKRLFPDLVNPRMPSIEDIGSEMDQYHFINGGFAFTVAGDFSYDGVADNAFVGKYDQPGSTEPQYFLAIVSIRKQYGTVRYFLKLGTQRVVLLRVEKHHRNRDAILAVTQFETDNCSYILWNGKKYERRPCD